MGFDWKPIDDSALDTPSSAPVPAPAPQWEQPPTEVKTWQPTPGGSPAPVGRVAFNPQAKTIPNWVTIGLACLCAFLMMMLFRGWILAIFVDGGTIDDNWPHDAFPGTAVLLVEHEQQTPRRDYKSGQVSTIMDLRSWADENAKTSDGNPAYLAIDLEQDISKLPRYWTDMLKEIETPPPCVAVLSGRKFTEFELPAAKDQLIRKLEAAK